MATSSEEIRERISRLEAKAVSFQEKAKEVTEACFAINKAWSGSTLVGHAKFFYEDFQEPGARNRFNIEWGLINGIPSGWKEKTDEEVRTKIEQDSGVSLDAIKDLAIELEATFLQIQREAVLLLSESGLIEADIERIEKFTAKTATDYFNDLFSTSYMTRDTGSMGGYYVAPHIYYDAVARFVSNFPTELKSFLFEFEKVARKKVVERISEDPDSSKYYVENSRILNLSELRSDKHDLTKLIKMCKELNDNYSLENFLSCGMLLRSILNHVPPIFGKTTFKEVVNNYGTKTFKDTMAPLEDSARKISDSYLHDLIQKKEILPNRTQVNFKPNIDVLLSEIIRILSAGRN